MDLRVWQTLAEPAHEKLIRVASETNPRDVAALDRLRKVIPDRELNRAALLLAEARRKAASKFGQRAAALWGEPQGIEMASSLIVARYKAARFAETFAGEHVLDLCCGIGGDAIALAEAGLRVTAVDLDPVRAWMAQMNAGKNCESICADAADAGLWNGGARAFHIDPVRRTEDGARRIYRLEDLRPGVEVLAQIVERCGANGKPNGVWGGAMKLGPGVDMDEAAALGAGEIEVISENGRLTQAVAWFGSLARSAGGTRAATLLSDAGSTTLRGIHDATVPPVAPIAQFVLEIDDSVERAGLLNTVCTTIGASMVHPRLGLLTADRSIEHPMLTPFEVLEVLPWKAKRVKAALDALHAGIVEVKTRGGAVNPDQVQTDLRGKGYQLLTVFVLRFDRELRAIIARRVPISDTLSHRA